MSKKYVLVIFGFIVSIAVYGVIYYLGGIQINNPNAINLIPREYVTHFIVILPGPLASDVILLYLLPIGILLLSFIIGPYLLIAYLKLHKFTSKFGIKVNYGIADIGENLTILTLFKRAVLVSLFAFSVASAIVEAGLGDLFRANMIEDNPLNLAEAVFLGTFFFSFIVLILFIPIWLLEDTGVIGYRYDPNKRSPPKIESIASLYSNILEGFAGITTVVSIGLHIFRCFTYIQLTDPAILTPIILIFLPFIVTGLFAFPMVIYEKYLPKMTKKVSEKLGVDHIKFPEFDQVKY